MTTTAVLFDLDGTLLPLDFDAFVPRYMARLCKWYFAALGVDILGPSMTSVERMMGNDGRCSNADAFWTLASELIGRDRALLEQLYADFVAREAPGLAEGIHADPAARAAVEACRARGQRVALATNPVFPRVMIDERTRWAGLDAAEFDLVTCSDRMRWCKPRPEYYRQVAEALGVAPRECLMVGNDVAMDLVPAAAIGMRTCLVQGPFAIAADDAFRPDHRCTLAEVPALLAA